MCLDENTALNINNQVANDKGQKDSSKPDRQERVFAQAVQLKQTIKARHCGAHH